MEINGGEEIRKGGGGRKARGRKVWEMHRKRRHKEAEEEGSKMK